MRHFSKLLGLAIVMGGLTGSLPAKANLFFRDDDRPVLRSYITTTPAPGGTVTFYSPGTVLPDTVTYTELPTTVTTKLVAPPQGDEYVYIGHNVYLIDREKRVVVDADKIDDDD